MRTPRSMVDWISLRIWVKAWSLGRVERGGAMKRGVGVDFG